LQIGNGGTSGSILGRIENNAILIINRSDALTLSGIIDGTGQFVQAGTGTTTLTGANAYTGGTLIQAGRLRGDVTSLQGVIQIDAGTLEFNQAAAGTFNGRLSGAGAVEKTGAGLLTYNTDNSNLTGGTLVSAGELRVNGLLSRSRVTVGNGATLSGTSTVGGIVAQSGGTVAPGAGGFGTLSVNGNLQFLAGSTFAVQVQPAGSDL
jgi:fibronectin-binding autotransporter adhesin